jgi:hypothetical protein
MEGKALFLMMPSAEPELLHSPQVEIKAWVFWVSSVWYRVRSTIDSEY